MSMCPEPLYEHSCVTLRNPTIARGERGERAAAGTYISQWKPSHEVHAVILEDKSQVLRVTLCRLDDTCFGKGSLLTRSFASSGRTPILEWKPPHEVGGSTAGGAQAVRGRCGGPQRLCEGWSGLGMRRLGRCGSTKEGRAAAVRLNVGIPQSHGQLLR